MNHRVAVFAAIGMMGWVFYWFDNAGNVLLRRTLVWVDTDIELNLTRNREHFLN